MDFNKSAMSESITIPFGKYKGEVITEVPDTWIIWAMENLAEDHFLRKAVEEEFDIRGIVLDGNKEEDEWWLYN